MSSIISLKDRHVDATQKLILTTAVDLLERSGVGDLTIRAVARAAGMSERTLFRYYATRDEFLNAVAAEAVVRMQAPPPPANADDLLPYVGRLYKSFERNGALIRAILHTDLVKRVRVEAADERWSMVRDLVNKAAPDRSPSARKAAATNINYFLSATTWNYYRTSFGLNIKDSISYAEAAIAAIFTDIGQKTD